MNPPPGYTVGKVFTEVHLGYKGTIAAWYCEHDQNRCNHPTRAKAIKFAWRHYYANNIVHTPERG